MSSGYFDDQVGPLKRAAIDAWMVSEGWVPSEDGDDYWGRSALGALESVSRPDENGDGGGDWGSSAALTEWGSNDDEDQYYRSAFDDIRSWIDERLNRWRDIPDGKDIATLVEAMRQASRALSTGVEKSDDTITGTGGITGDLKTIQENSDHMAGGMITAFKTNFLLQLGAAISGLHAIAVILGGHLAAQEMMWTGARTSVVDLITQSTEAFKAVAEETEVDWKVVLKVTGYVLAGVTLFATDGAGKAVTDLGLQILHNKLDEADKSTDKPSATYDSVKEAFARDLKSLDAKITRQEEKIDDNILQNLRQIRLDTGAYDLRRPPLLDVDDDSDLGKPGEMQIDPILVEEITGTCMPHIAQKLHAAQGHVDEAADTNVLLRDDTIGVSRSGPNQYLELRWLLWELLGNLAWEVKNSAKTLELAVQDIGQSDTSAKDALDKHAGEVRDSGGPDPWDEPHVPRGY